MEVEPYQESLADVWNTFNKDARNGHFIFDRGFMGYHADRFEDCSLVVFDHGEPVALFPGNRSGTEVWSHQGLTFGGLITGEAGSTQIMAILDACTRRLVAEGATSLSYKPSPWIYHRAPAQEDLYWLFRQGAALYRRDISVAIDYRARGRVSGRRLRGARKGEKAGLTLGRSTDWAGFWRLLESVLADRHGASPVHSRSEIEMLAGRFPEEIGLSVASAGDELLAGVVMFRSAFVAHAQYIAVGEEGRAAGALDALFEHLIDAHALTHRYFDFGISNTGQGLLLNEGLVRQKEEFGGSVLAHDFYKISNLA